jgi:hypothetical protein
MYDYLYLNSIREGCQTAERLDSYLTDSAKRSGFRLRASGYSGKVKKWPVWEEGTRDEGVGTSKKRFGIRESGFGIR